MVVVLLLLLELLYEDDEFDLKRFNSLLLFIWLAFIWLVSWCGVLLAVIKSRDLEARSNAKSPSSVGFNRSEFSSSLGARISDESIIVALLYAWEAKRCSDGFISLVFFSFRISVLGNRDYKEDTRQKKTEIENCVEGCCEKKRWNYLIWIFLVVNGFKKAYLFLDEGFLCRLRLWSVWCVS